MDMLTVELIPDHASHAFMPRTAPKKSASATTTVWRFLATRLPISVLTGDPAMDAGEGAT